MKLILMQMIILLISGFVSCTSYAQHADVVEVAVKRNGQQYTFSVTLRSPDKGCEQYADWWEVISPEGNLIYRRILRHSHVDEQPFTRSGGPVKIGENTEVIVRAHMNNSGFGGKVMRGKVSAGFSEVNMPHEFAISLEKQEPLPQGCDF